MTGNRKNNRSHKQKMRVSFDLDEVLFVSPMTHQVEPPLKWPFRIIYKERLRLGTVDLIHELQRRDIDVWVYTSSFRSVRYIKGLFSHYHLRFADIINGSRHLEEVQGTKNYRVPSKLPSYYHIALHIDDEMGVINNGRLHGFNVMLVDEPDNEWANKILKRALEIQNQNYR